jgi:hypothetical protein
MSETLTRDAGQLHRALAKDGDQVRLTVSRDTAEWMARLVDARVEGQEIVLANALEEVTPTQAADCWACPARRSAS